MASAGLESHGRTPSPSPTCSSSPSPSGRPGPFSSNRYGASVPIPVPTQVHNYQRIEQNLQSPTQQQTARLVSLTSVRVLPLLWTAIVDRLQNSCNFPGLPSSLNPSYWQTVFGRLKSMVGLGEYFM